MSNLSSSYSKILELLHELENRDNYLNQIRTPKLSDKQLIANQLDHKPFNPLLRKTRKRIETLFSRLCDQFMIRRNYAKPFQGLAARVLSKLAALTMIQWLNQRNGNHLYNLKIGIA